MISRTSKTRVIVIGAGIHGKIVGSVVMLCPHLELAGFLDRDKRSPDEQKLGKDIATSFDDLHGEYSFIVGVGNNQDRKEWYDEVKRRHLPLVTIIHPSAVVHPQTRIGEGCFVGPLAVINVDAEVGVNSIINSGAIIEHDVVVGDHCHIAPNAALAGRVRVHDLVFVGIGSSVRDKAVIGEGAVVGAGAAVVKDVPAGDVVVGVPARRLER